MTKNMSWKLALVLALFPVPAFAQLPFSAGYKPIVTASVGYSYMSFPMTSSARMNLNGVDASITADFHSRFGAKLDFNYVQASNALGTGQRSDVASYMLGPMFYPVSNALLTVYVQALGGESRVIGVVPNGTGGFDAAYAQGPSWAFGGGIERGISPSLAIRTETDYVHTAFVSSSQAFRGQNDVRITSSLVYRWGGRSGGRREHRRF